MAVDPKFIDAIVTLTTENDRPEHLKNGTYRFTHTGGRLYLDVSEQPLEVRIFYSHPLKDREPALDPAKPATNQVERYVMDTLMWCDASGIAPILYLEKPVARPTQPKGKPQDKEYVEVKTASPQPQPQPATSSK